MPKTVVCFWDGVGELLPFIELVELLEIPVSYSLRRSQMLGVDKAREKTVYLLGEGGNLRGETSDERFIQEAEVE